MVQAIGAVFSTVLEKTLEIRVWFQNFPSAYKNKGIDYRQSAFRAFHILQQKFTDCI